MPEVIIIPPYADVGIHKDIIPRNSRSAASERDFWTDFCCLATLFFLRLKPESPVNFVAGGWMRNGLGSRRGPRLAWIHVAEVDAQTPVCFFLPGGKTGYFVDMQAEQIRSHAMGSISYRPLGSREKPTLWAVADPPTCPGIPIKHHAHGPVMVDEAPPVDTPDKRHPPYALHTLERLV